MKSNPRRIVEVAFIERLGLVTAEQLLAMPDDSWGMLRDRITDLRNGKDGLAAKCALCGSPVFIRGFKISGVSRPSFNHYSGGDPDCPWRHERNAKPNDVRAAQYQGRQESNFHRLMCELVGELAALDNRYIKHTVAEYLPPTENAFGRYPDVYIEWKGFGSFAVEFQLSGSFQTEISGRCKHYEYEQTPLLWILFGAETALELSQSMIDVIRRHRGNAFFLDPPAVAASREQRTLILSCCLRSQEGRLSAPKLVRFDELHIPNSKLPFFEDMIAGPRLAKAKASRSPWFRALERWKDRYQPLCGLDHAPSLLVAAAFSIVATAKQRKQINYASNQPNITSMLNTYLSTRVFSPYVDLIAQLIMKTAIDGLIKPSVKEHLRDYRDEVQVGRESPEWRLLEGLFPELLDPLLHEELCYLEALPEWATP